MVEIIGEGELAEAINFDGSTRGPQNIVGFVALVRLSFIDSQYLQLQNAHLLLSTCIFSKNNVLRHSLPFVPWESFRCPISVVGSIASSFGRIVT